MTEKSIFITGTTGFLGSHLTYQLLAQGYKVYALVRDSKEGQASDRMIKLFHKIGRKHDGLPENFVPIMGDLRLDSSEDIVARIREVTDVEFDEVWHSAVSFKIKEKYRDEVEEINIKGAEKILNVVVSLNTGAPPRYFHISTAYCGGRDIKHVPESQLESTNNFRSLYEWSKHSGEALVAKYQKDHGLNAVIFRPSVVVGTAETNVLNYSGYYTLLKEGFSIRKMMEHKMGDSFDGYLGLRLCADENLQPNLVPIDYVINAMLMISNHPNMKDNTLQFFNIVNDSESVSIGRIKDIMCDALKLNGVDLVSKDALNESPQTYLESLFDQRIEFQAPYIREKITFSTDRFRDYIPENELPPPNVDEEFIASINAKFFDMHERKLAGN